MSDEFLYVTDHASGKDEIAPCFGVLVKGKRVTMSDVDAEFERRASDWEGRMERIIVEMAQERAVDGRPIRTYDWRPIAEWMSGAIEHIRAARKSAVTIVEPRDTAD